MSAALGAKGCLHHLGREAAARCPECREFFCRECITEHDGRVICSACLKKVLPAKSETRRSWGALARPALCACGVLAAWFYFHLIGSLASQLPSSFHSKSLWESLGGAAGSEEED